MLLTRERVQDGRTEKLMVTKNDVGWHVREEHDSHVVKSADYTDWHRVERAMYVFDLRTQLATD